MYVALIQFTLSFTAVFLKGLQHQNVIGGKYLAAWATSMAMATFDVAVIGYIVQAGWASLIPVGFGASLGIVSSMYLYRKKWSKKV